MNSMSRLLTLGALLLGLAGAAGAQQAIQLTRQDQGAVPATAYIPSAASCRGIVVLSPGAGGSEKGYGYLGQAMASLGYLSVVVGHEESGRDAVRSRMRSGGLREGLADLITDPDAYRARFLDIVAAYQWARDRCKAGEAILIGHSMGAATAMIEAGASNKLGIKGGDAFDIYVALSPQGVGSIFPGNAWAGIRKPVLMLTGTRDIELGGASWETRKEPFANMHPGCKWLGVLEGATHLNFAGLGLSRNIDALTIRVIKKFLEGVHRKDCTPPERLAGLELLTK